MLINECISPSALLAGISHSTVFPSKINVRDPSIAALNRKPDRETPGPPVGFLNLLSLIEIEQNPDSVAMSTRMKPPFGDSPIEDVQSSNVLLLTTSRGQHTQRAPPPKGELSSPEDKLPVTWHPEKLH
jgi:hypothetical protein